MLARLSMPREAPGRTEHQVAPAQIRFRTETGSVYEIARDAEGKRWRRLSATLGSGVLRSEEGRLRRWPDVRVGRRCLLWSEPINAPFPRYVVTSRVAAVLDSDQAEERAGGASFGDVRPGDLVVRCLGGAPMELRVTSVDEAFIYCGDPGIGWKFDRDSGVEVDEEIGWGPAFGIVGSY